MTHYLESSCGGPKFRSALVLVASILAWLVIGCGEPVNSYRTAQADIPRGDRVLIMPFLDARTFTDPRDPYRESLGEHARNIFATVMRTHDLGKGRNIITPAMPRAETSMTIAEAAEAGRAHDADYVVAGQMFSFTETRAASIPPRAGMFVRVVSVKDGSLVFVGDDYQAAPIPGASGGREQQARLVAKRLLDNMAAKQIAFASPSIRSGSALASVMPGPGNPAPRGREGDLLPEAPPPLPDFFNGDAEEQSPEDDKSGNTATPEAPPLLDYGSGDDFYAFTQDDATASGDEPAASEPIPSATPETASGTGSETPVPAAGADTAAGITDADAESAPAPAETAESPETVPAEPAVLPPPAETAEIAATAAVESVESVESAEDGGLLSGDELAADLFEAEETPEPVAAAEEEDSPDEAEDAGGPETAAVAEEPAAAPVEAGNSPLAASEPEIIQPVAETGETDNSYHLNQRQYFEAMGDGFPGLDGAVALEPIAVPLPESAVVVGAQPELAVAQPTPVHAVDMVERTGVVDSPAPDAVVKVLLLPYHERENPDNLIPHTGGGEVVTALFGSRLATDPGIQVHWAGTGYSHGRLATAEEAVAVGRLAGVDYVVRGQVTEFRRAQSVPSFYSLVVSTAILAAQVLFAEISGVDVATEVYRVSDGVCVMSRRDRSQQKYVVQAEKTVRRLAEGMAEAVTTAMREPAAMAMDPIIDGSGAVREMAAAAR